MSDYLTTDTELTSIADAIRTKGGTSASLVYPTGFVSAIEAIATKENYQAKTVSPTESEIIVQPDTSSGYGALSSVTVNAISSTYVGSGIARNSSANLTVSGATVTAPAGYYAAAASASVAAGTAGTPTATKGTVSNHSISVTPKVTNTTGYITGSTKTGTAVTVAASELDSGTKTITANSTNIDVVGYAIASVNVQPALQSKTNITPTTSSQTISADSTYYGLSSVQINAIPTQYKDTTGADAVASNVLTGKKFVNTIGLVTGTMANNTATTTTLSATSTSYTIPSGYHSGSGKVQVTLETKTATPTESSQDITPTSGKVLSKVTVGAISSNYVGSNIPTRASGDLSASGSVVTVPSGYYSAQVTKAVSAGTAGTPTATKGTVSNHSISVTPSVTNTTGYITGSTKTGTAVTVSASELVSGSQTITTNDTYDVTNLAEVVVNVPTGGGSGVVVTETTDTSGGIVKNITAVDLSNDTVDAAHLLSGYTAHNNVGTAITGTYTPTSSTLKLGALRPDAELVKSWTYDKLLVTNEGITIPAYTTTAQTIVASESLSSTYAADFSEYDYFITERLLLTPVYSNTSALKGKPIYHFACAGYELFEIPAGTIAWGGKTYGTSLATILTLTANNRLVYWSSTTAISLYSTTSYFGQAIVAPSITTSGTTSTITAKTPNINLRGSTSYMSSDAWDVLTDIREQYIIEVYRAPKNNLNINGFNETSLANHIISCAQGTGTLT